MTHLLPLLPAVGCVAMMFGAGALARLARGTALGRALPFNRQTRSGGGEKHRAERPRS